jgi:hypothetical protein
VRAVRKVHSGNHSALPQPVDLLETYRGLVSVGKIKYDEEQVRVIMQVWNNYSWDYLHLSKTAYSLGGYKSTW